MTIINIVNSIIGKKGNIGLRTSYIVKELNKRKVENFTYSRGAEKEFLSNNKNLGIFGFIPRVLNLYRVYINKNFNNRIYDIKLFNLFLKIFFKDIGMTSKLCHLWETSPQSINKMKKLNYKVILDVPIAPTKYAITTFKHYENNLKIDYNYNIKCEQESFEMVDYIISPSKFVTNKITELGISSTKIFTVPFGVDLKDIKRKDFSKDYKKGIDYCFAGTISKRKGIELLLNVWQDEKFENDRLHLCGRLYPEIEKLLKKYNFKNVYLPGFVDTKEYFRKCDIYVFPSFLEGSSKSIYEAMSASMPCVVTDNCGSVIINEEDGFIIDIANENELKEKMMYFKENHEKIKTMGMKAFANVQQYSWKNYADNVIDIYERVVDE